MISSMTGYAAVTREVAAGSIALELRSVNSRFLDVQFRIAEELRSVEPGLRELAMASLARGKIDCRLGFAESPAARGETALNAEALERLARLARRVREAIPDAEPLRVADVLHWPGVLAEESLSAEGAKEQVLGLLARAIADLDQTRAREGAKLEAILRDRLDRMAALVKEAEPLMPGAVKAFADKLAAKVSEAGASPSDERIHQEIVLYAARIDVDEELSRLVAHITEFRRVLGKGGACGKRLDFLCQELNREANTLGSKSVANELTRISVELKVLIEQMREQVQNIE